MLTLDVPLELFKQVARYERADLLDKLVGLGLSPEYHANAARIEILIYVALTGARGKKRATRNELAALLNGLGDFIRRNEDPAEDVFVSAVSMPIGQFRIFNGIFAGADYSLQRLLDAVLSRDFSTREAIERQCAALLRLSEAVARRCNFAINQFAESRYWRTDWPLSLPVLTARGAATHFAYRDLIELGVDPADLEPFCIHSLDGLLDDAFGEIKLHRWPIIKTDSGIHLPIPSFVSPALRLYLAQAISSGVIPSKAVEVFHSSLIFRWIGVDLMMRRAKPIETAPLNLPKPQLDLSGVTQAVLRFDEDKIVYILVMEFDWHVPPERNVHQAKTASAKFNTGLTEHLRSVYEKLSKDMGVKRGLTLVIQDSPGWGLDISLPESLADDWYCAQLPARGFASLLADPEFSLIDFWKMLREVRELEVKRVRMMAWPDMLNWWSIWQAFGSTFWQKEVDLRDFGWLLPDTSRIVELMRLIRLRSNVHATPTPTGEWLRVERYVEKLAPSQEYKRPLYVDPIAMALGKLCSVLETSYGPWWVAAARPPLDPQDQQLLYLLWQAAAEWLLRIARCGADRLTEVTRPLEIRLLPLPDTALDAPDEIEILEEDEAIVTIVLPPSFPDRLMTVDNAGEKLLIRALIDGLLLALHHPLPDETRVQWTAEVAANPNLKMIHITRDADYGFAADLLADRFALRLLQATDIETAKRFMREALESILASGVIKATESVSGKAAVKAVLNTAVDVHWDRCKALLTTLDREKTLVLISRLIEAVHRDRVASERGGPARLLHYSESPEYTYAAPILMGLRDRSFHAYRVVAEMALCECPSLGGRAPGLTDIDALAAEVAALIEIAYNSDGVERDLIDARLSFRPDGAIEFANGGAGAFIESHTMACLNESLALDVDAYPTLFEPDPEEIEVLLSEDDPYLVAFRAEFGLDLRQCAEVSNALQAIAVDKEADVVAVRQSELAGLLTDECAASLPGFLKCFGLEAREAWDRAPAAPYTLSDVRPWLFERRLSLMLRPVLMVLDRPNDPLLVFGVRQIDMGVRYASTLLEAGGWPREKLSSDTARDYVDQEVNSRGNAFETEIAATVRGAGWQAIESTPMTQLGAAKQLGDLDVLGIDQGGRCWWVIECKRAGAARTPREIANWLNDFRGHDGDKLDRHLKRVEWIRKNRALVAARLGVSVVPDRIEPRIVSSFPVPLALQKNLPAGSDVLTKRELRERLNSHQQA